MTAKNLKHLKEYAENLMVQSGVNLENVHVHNEGQFGQAGICTTFESRYDYKLYGIKFNLIPNTPYVIVPEVTDWWSFRAWVHEIGHLKNRHYNTILKPLYYQEYEAELFCIETAKGCNHIGEEVFIKIKDSAIEYLLTFIENDIEYGYFKSIKSIPNEVKNFLFKYGGNHYKVWLNDKFNEREDKFIYNFKKYFYFFYRVRKKIVYLSNKVKHDITNIFIRCSQIMVWGG